MFETYYKSRNQGKCIKYCIQMCTSLIQANFSKSSVKLLELSGIQAIVLLAFNDLEQGQQELSFQQLKDLTGLEGPELRKQLISLSMSEHQVLVIVDDTMPLKMQEEKAATTSKPAMLSKKMVIKKQITKDDKFKVNRNFRSKMKKIQINALQRKETRQESDAVHDKVLQDRKYYIDAAVVKTMKARKTMKHSELVAEVLRMTRFPCEVDQIVARFKYLMEAEYMKPDEKDDKLYHYLA